MNSQVEDYRHSVLKELKSAIETRFTSMRDILPVSALREGQVFDSEFARGSDPMMVSWSLQISNRSFEGLTPDRKTSLRAAQYINKSAVELIYRDGPVTVVFIGDSNSDRKLAYNFERLVATGNRDIKVISFITNNDLVGPFGQDSAVELGWNGTKSTFIAKSWEQLPELMTALENDFDTRNVLFVVDFDGTLLCPRPIYTPVIKDARVKALGKVCEHLLDKGLFDPDSGDHWAGLREAQTEAENVEFSKALDDADTTAAIALAVYTGVIDPSDPLLNPKQGVGFQTPVDFLQFAVSVCENHPIRSRELGRVRKIFVNCADALLSGAASWFEVFRESEEEVLLEETVNGNVVINRYLVQFLLEAVNRGAVPIGFSDRPNASLGLEVTNPRLDACGPKNHGSLVCTKLPLG